MFARLIYLFLVFSLALPVMAEDIVLTNGRAFHAVIKETKTNEFVVDLSGVLITYKFSEIELINNKTVSEFLAAQQACSPANIKKLYNQGLDFAAKGDFEQARNVWLNAVKNNTKNLDFDFAALLELLDLADSERKRTAARHFFTGLELFAQTQDYSRALDQFKMVINYQPDWGISYYYLGLVYNALKKYRDAIEVFTQAARSLKQKPELYYQLGEAYYLSQQYKSALSAYAKAVELNSSFELAFLKLGLCYANLKQPQHALYYYTNVIRINPDNPLAYFQLGEAYYLLKNYNFAHEQFTVAKQLYRVLNDSAMIERIDRYLELILVNPGQD